MVTFRRRRSGALSVAALAAVLVLAAGCGGSSSSSTSTASSGGGASATTGTSSAASTTSSGGGEIAQYTGPESKLPSTFPTPKKTGKSFTVGFLNPIAANESLDALQNAVGKTAQLLGGKMIPKDDQLKVDKQVSDFDQLLAQKVDAIIVYPIDPKALGPSLKQAKAAGVPVVGVDVTANVQDPLPSDYSAQVTQGRDQQAFLQVQLMKAADAQAKIGIIGIGSPVPALKYLLTREEAYAKQAGLTVQGEQDNPTDDAAGGQQAASALLGKYPDMTGIIGYNDPSALGAVAAARTTGRQIKAVGLNAASDGIEGVKTGRLVASIQADQVGLGQQAVYAAYDTLTKQGGKLPKTVVRPNKVVTKETVGSLKTWAEQTKELTLGS